MNYPKYKNRDAIQKKRERYTTYLYITKHTEKHLYRKLSKKHKTQNTEQDQW